MCSLSIRTGRIHPPALSYVVYGYTWSLGSSSRNPREPQTEKPTPKIQSQDPHWIHLLPPNNRHQL